MFTTEGSKGEKHYFLLLLEMCHQQQSHVPVSVGDLWKRNINFKRLPLRVLCDCFFGHCEIILNKIHLEASHKFPPR